MNAAPQPAQLFDKYAPTPRPLGLAGNLQGEVRMTWLGVVGVVIGSFVLGAPMSFLRFRSSREWLPIDLLIMPAIILVFTLPIAIVVVVVFSRYARLFRTGQLVAGTVVELRNSGMLLQVEVPMGPSLTFIPGQKMQVGTRLPVIIGNAMSSLALVVVADGKVRRGSLLTREQLGNLVVS